MLDFERAEHIAVQNIFPSATIRGCLFYWKKTLIEHFDKIPGYKTDNTVKDILHATFGVAFVLIEHVELAWQHIKKTLQADSVHSFIRNSVPKSPEFLIFLTN